MEVSGFAGRIRIGWVGNASLPPPCLSLRAGSNERGRGGCDGGGEKRKNYKNCKARKKKVC